MDIEVTFVGPGPNPGPDTVRANLNPQPVSSGETVTWRFDASRELQVLFVEVVDLSSGSTPEPCNPLGPLESVLVKKGTIEGKVRADLPDSSNRMTRYFYKLIENGVDLNWDPSVSGKLTNGGGIDTSGRPPGG
jgi:hypothetical protein